MSRTERKRGVSEPDGERQAQLWHRSAALVCVPTRLNNSHGSKHERTLSLFTAHLTRKYTYTQMSHLKHLKKKALPSMFKKCAHGQRNGHGKETGGKVNHSKRHEDNKRRAY